MTIAEEKDWILTEINKAGIIDVTNRAFMDKTDEKRYWLYHKHKHVFVYRQLVEQDVGSSNTVNNDYFWVKITDLGAIFLDGGGFQAEETQKNAELSDKIDIKQAIIYTARWQRNGVWASFFIGVITIGITLYTANKTSDADKQTERINHLEKRLDSLSYALEISLPITSKHNDSVGLKPNTKLMMRTPKR